MDIFGDNWVDHAGKIRENWMSKITDEDLVLIPGDISWAIHLEEARPDLDWLCQLPGIKLVLRGNHDYWWVTLTKMKKAYPGLNFLQNTSYVYNGCAVCGTRGWLLPGDQGFDEDQDAKIYQRELLRLKLSLETVKKGVKKITAMMHYPPCTLKQQSTGFTDILESYGVCKVIYGHVHNQFEGIFEGERNGVVYQLVSSDYIGFNPVLIEE